MNVVCMCFNNNNGSIVENVSVLGLLLCFRSVGLVLFEREGCVFYRSQVFETEREGLLLCFRSLVFETERGWLLLCFRSVGVVLFETEREGLLCFRSVGLILFETEREGLLCFRSVGLVLFETEREGLLCFRSVGLVLFEGLLLCFRSLVCETEREGLLLCFRSVGLVLFETEREGLLLCFRSPCLTSGWRETCQSVQSALSVIKRVAAFSDYRTTAVSGAEPW